MNVHDLFKTLRYEDLPVEEVTKLVAALPDRVRELMENTPGIVIAGGFCRDTLYGVEHNDIDIYPLGRTSAAVQELASTFAGRTPSGAETFRMYTTDNATTVHCDTDTGIVQFVHNRPYETIEEILDLFDFRVCQVALLYENGGYRGVKSTLFDCDASKGELRWAGCREASVGAHFRIPKLAARGWNVPPATVVAVTQALFEHAALSGKVPAQLFESYLKDTYELQAGAISF